MPWFTVSGDFILIVVHSLQSYIYIMSQLNKCRELSVELLTGVNVINLLFS